jgi:uncharacterized protein (DUF2267 family)
MSDRKVAFVRQTKHDKHQAYLALRAVLHALRDRLTVEEVAQLGAQQRTRRATERGAGAPGRAMPSVPI